MKAAQTWSIGMRVRATQTIIENDMPENPSAEPCTPGWVHARPGDFGQVVDVDDGYAFVEFDRGTQTLVSDCEIEAITCWN